MPKIPLYQQQSSIGTAKGVSVNPSVGVNLVEAESAADQVLTKGMFNIMEETIGAGQEYLKTKKEQDIKSGKHKFALWKTRELPEEMEAIKTRGASEGMDVSGIYGLKINPYLDSAFENWAKENNVNITQDLRDEWELDKEGLKRKEIIAVNKIQQEQFKSDTMELAQDLFKSDQIEEGRALIKSIGLDPEEERRAMSVGFHDYYAYKMQTANSMEEIQEVVTAFENDDNLSFSSRNSLRLRVASSEKSFLSTKASPAQKTADQLLKDNELTEDWIEKSSMTESNKDYYRGALKAKDVPYLQDTNYNPNEDKIIAPDGNQLGIGLKSSTYLSDELTTRVHNLMMGDTEDFSADLKIVFDLANSTSGSTGEAFFTPALKAKILAPLMNLMADEERNGIFLTDAKPNTYNDIEIKTLRLMREQFAKIQGLSATRQIEGFADVFTKVNEFLDNIRDNAGITVVKDPKTGKETFYSYEDDIMDAVDKAMSIYGIKVAQQVRNDYYKREQERREETQRILMAPVFEATGGQMYQEDDELIEEFGESPDLLKPEPPKSVPIKITKIPKAKTKQEKNTEAIRIAKQEKKRKAEESRNRSGRFGIQ